MGKSTRLLKKFKEAVKEEYGLNASIDVLFHTSQDNPNNFKIGNNVVNDFATAFDLEKGLKSNEDTIFIQSYKFSSKGTIDVTYYLKKRQLQNDY